MTEFGIFGPSHFWIEFSPALPIKYIGHHEFRVHRWIEVERFHKKIH